MNETILVIEDNEKHCFLFEDMLTDEGYNVVTAKDGNELEQKITESEQTGKPFDLLLVDLAVPNFEDPVDFIRKHKEKGYRIVVISAYMSSFDLQGILEEEWKIKKPFDTNVLISKVKERLALPIKEAKQ